MPETVLITGGSEGIGYAFARCYGERQAVLYLCARREEKLKEAQKRLIGEFGCEVHIIPGDLSRPESVYALHHAFAGKTPDVVINNAGMGYTGKALDSDLKQDHQMIDLNIRALTDLTKLFARDMVKRGKGLIINLSSTGAFQPGPYIAEYYASKAFVLSYSEALNEELKGTGVHICTVCPGPVDTKFYDKSGGVKPPLALKPDEAAAYVLKHVQDDVVVPGFSNQMARFLPARMKMKAVEKMKKVSLSDHGSSRRDG
jgi:short-subunit dehydrogenase